MRLLPFLLLLLLGGLAQAQRPAHYVRAPHPHAARPAATAQAYYCASGNVVKYHSSATCRGLNRCSATVKPLSFSEAQSQMEPCKICH